MLGIGPLVIGNVLHLLDIMSQIGIMSQSGLFRIRDNAAFVVMSHSGLWHSGLCRIRYYVIRDYVAIGIMSQSGLCLSA